MANKIQFRRGSDAERGTVKLDSGEPGWTTDTNKLYVGDGATYGGILVTGGGGGGGAGTLCALSDVSCAGTVDGRALTYQAGTWVSRGTVVVEQIPTLPTARITTGTFVLARIPAVDDARIPDLETLSYGAAFATAQVPSLGAYKITTGTFTADRILALANLKGTVTDAKIPDLETLSYGAAFATAQIPAIGAYKISSGTLGLARIPSIDDVRIPDLDTLSYSAAFADAQIPNLAASKITTGTFNVNRIETLDTLKGTVTADKVAALGASKITTGTLGLARIPAVDDARIPDLETLSYGAAFATGQIPNLGASKITSGSFNANRIPILPTARITTGTFNLNRIPAMDDAHIPNVDGLGYGGAFAEAQIPNLPTTKITSGSFNADRIPGLPTSRITSGTFGLARIPSIDNAHLTGGITSDKIPALSGTAIAYPLNVDTVGTTAIKASGVGNDELAASGLDISKFTVGTAGLARIPTMDDAHVPDLETLSYGAAFATAQIPNLPTTKITSGSFNANRIPILPTDRYGSAVVVSGTRPLTGDLDFAKHQAKAMVWECLGSAPVSPATAQTYYNTTTDKVMVYVA